MEHGARLMRSTKFQDGSKRCWQCRGRRILCDVHFPACGQCVQAGIQCPGYGPKRPLRFLPPSVTVPRSRPRRRPDTTVRTQNLVHQVPVIAVRCPPARAIPILAPYFDNNDDEAYGFCFFRDCVQNFSPTEFGVHWEHQAYAYALQKPGLRDVLALLGLLLFAKARWRLDHWESMPFRLYDKAISHARHSIPGPESFPLALLLCITFALVEFQLHHWAQGHVHLRMAVRLFKNWIPLLGQECALQDLILSPAVLYASLPLEVLDDIETFNDGRQSVAVDYSLPYPFTPHQIFQSGSDMHYALMSILRAARSFQVKATSIKTTCATRLQRQSLEATQAQILALLSAWDLCVEDSVTQGQFSDLDMQLCRQLQVRMLCCKTAIIAALSGSGNKEKAWDAAIPDFARLCDISDTSINCIDAVFMFKSGVSVSLILSLVHTALKCRDPQIRTTACRLLRQIKVGTETTLGCQYAEACEIVILLEEEGQDVSTASDVPLHRRVNHVDFKFGESGILSIEPFQRCAEGKGGLMRLGIFFLKH